MPLPFHIYCINHLYSYQPSLVMKKLFFSLTFLATLYWQPSPAQTSSTTSQLLTSYYGIKDALVVSDAGTASIQATAFEKTLQAIDMKSLPGSSMTTFMALQDKLSKDASFIASNKNVSRQRDHFASFSANMLTLAKGLKLSTLPIYETYCPMKKAIWLSSEAVIKNPYFGNQMLTCGKVTETVQ